MRHTHTALTYLLFGLAVLSPSLCEANGGGSRSYTAVGAPRTAYDPPTQFVGGFGQMYQAPATLIDTPAPAPAVMPAQAAGQVICVPAQAGMTVYVLGQQPVRWMRRAR